MIEAEVIISQLAKDQICNHVDFIAVDSMTHAIAWESRLMKSIREIGTMAGSHAMDEDASERIGSRVHKVVFEGTYLIHYVFDREAKAVYIINFRHGARLPRKNEP